MKEGAAALKADSKPRLNRGKTRPARSVTSLREATQLSSPGTVLHFPCIKADLQEGPMNGTFFEVDRDTHVKVVFAALCAAISVLAVAIALH